MCTIIQLDIDYLLFFVCSVFCALLQLLVDVIVLLRWVIHVHNFLFALVTRIQVDSNGMLKVAPNLNS
jgi:hypothetical protein